MKPTIGRMVYYKSRGSADGVFPPTDRAAIVTDVNGVYNQIRLCVINPEGLFFTGWLDQGQAPGQWDWMPFQKDQQMRYANAGNILSSNKNKNMSEETNVTEAVAGVSSENNTRGAASPEESAPADEAVAA